MRLVQIQLSIKGDENQPERYQLNKYVGHYKQNIIFRMKLLICQLELFI